MRLLGVLVAVMLTCYCAPVLAVTITSDSGFNGPTVLVDFSQFVVTTNGPSLQVGNLIGEDVVLSERNGFNSVVMNGIQGLSDNGQWDTGRNGFVSAFATTNLSHEFTFNGGLISEFGFVMNYGAFNGTALTSALIEAVDSSGVVLESFDVIADAMISTPGEVNTGAFRGISRNLSDIKSIRITGSQLVLDDLQFGRSVPEPASLALLAIGLIHGYGRSLSRYH